MEKAGARRPRRSIRLASKSVERLTTVQALAELENVRSAVHGQTNTLPLDADQPGALGFIADEHRLSIKEPRRSRDAEENALESECLGVELLRRSIEVDFVSRRGLGHR